MKAITEREGESFPHRILWRCVLAHYERARSIEKGSKHFDLTTMLMAYLTYEAYLNFVGDRLAPDLWAQEKSYFTTGKYAGLEGKLKKICELCDGLKVNKGARPYQTITMLSVFRDSVVHAKPYKYEDSMEHPVDREPDWWPRDSYDCVTEEQTSKVVEDVEKFIEFLHQKALPHIHDKMFGDKALKGVLGYASSSTSFVE
ncbi:MAG TPA: hypothetical protein VIR60_01680 [Gammaproteobacteria bacterium]